MTDKQAAAKEWLNRNEPLRDEIRAMELRIAEMRAAVNNVVTVPKEVSVQTQPKNIQAEKIAEICDFDNKIKAKRLRFEMLQNKTTKTIDQLNDPVKGMILMYRYIYRRSWRYIADKMHYKESYIYEMHLKALTAIYPFIDWAGD